MRAHQTWNYFYSNQWRFEKQKSEEKKEIKNRKEKKKLETAKAERSLTWIWAPFEMIIIIMWKKTAEIPKRNRIMWEIKENKEVICDR